MDGSVKTDRLRFSPVFAGFFPVHNLFTLLFSDQAYPIIQTRRAVQTHRTFALQLAAIVFLALALLPPTTGYADNCRYDPIAITQPAADKITELRILGNDFPALHGLTDAVRECNKPVSFKTELTQNYRELQIPSLQSKPAAFDVVLTGNNAVVPLLNEALIRPLDSLIDQYAPDLPKRHKILFNGQTMAIALLANSQHLFVRDDLLAPYRYKNTLAFEEMIKLCKQLKDAGILDYPLAASFKSGWDLGLQFIEHYLAAGGEFAPIKKQAPGIQSESLDLDAGITALQRLKQMTECMNPDYLSHGSNEVQALWQGGQSAIAQLWGSRADSVLNSDDSLAIVKQHTQLMGAPIVADKSNAETTNTRPVATLWWVGFAIPANLPDERASHAFTSMLKGAMSPYLQQQHAAQTVWLSDAYEATPSAKGVQQVITSGAPAYPSNPYIGLYHQAAGQIVADFLLGRQSDTDTIKAIMAQVEASAFEKGLLSD